MHLNEQQAGAKVEDLKGMAASAGVDWMSVVMMLFSQGLPFVLKLLQDLIDTGFASDGSYSPLECGAL